MENEVDLLKIKVDEAKKKLPKETLAAIGAVDWQAVILSMRERKGYSIEQLGDLETETELLLCGLLLPENYPRELEKRMGISRAKVDELVNEMNELVFKKIREELIKNSEREKIFGKKKEAPAVSIPVPVNVKAPQNVAMPQIQTSDHDILKKAGIEIIKSPIVTPERLELEPPQKLAKEVRPILAQKLAGFVQSEVVQTEHSIDNMVSRSVPEIKAPLEKAPVPPAPTPTPAPKIYPPNADPYRLSPE